MKTTFVQNAQIDKPPALKGREVNVQIRILGPHDPDLYSRGADGTRTILGVSIGEIRQSDKDAITLEDPGGRKHEIPLARFDKASPNEYLQVRFSVGAPPGKDVQTPDQGSP